MHNQKGPHKSQVMMDSRDSIEHRSIEPLVVCLLVECRETRLFRGRRSSNSSSGNHKWELMQAIPYI